MREVRHRSLAPLFGTDNYVQRTCLVHCADTPVPSFVGYTVLRGDFLPSDAMSAFSDLFDSLEAKNTAYHQEIQEMKLSIGAAQEEHEMLVQRASLWLDEEDLTGDASYPQNNRARPIRIPGHRDLRKGTYATRAYVKNVQTKCVKRTVVLQTQMNATDSTVAALRLEVDGLRALLNSTNCTAA